MAARFAIDGLGRSGRALLRIARSRPGLEPVAVDDPGILAVSEEELVSSDFRRDPRSAVVDLPLVRALEGRLYRVVARFDNEWGHASRVADLIELAATGGGER